MLVILAFSIFILMLMNLDIYIYLDSLTPIWMWEMLEWLILWNGGSIFFRKWINMIFLSNFRIETFCKKNTPFSSLKVCTQNMREKGWEHPASKMDETPLILCSLQLCHWHVGHTKMGPTYQWHNCRLYKVRESDSIEDNTCWPVACFVRKGRPRDRNSANQHPR
jgi:hypothetical protein